MSDRDSRGSSCGSTPSALKEKTYLEPDSSKTKEGYLDPHYSPSSLDAKGRPSTGTSSTNKSSRQSSKSSKRPITKAAIIHNEQDAPKDEDRYDKTRDARYYKRSFLDSGEPTKKDSMASKAYDSGCWQNSSFYKD